MTLEEKKSVLAIALFAFIIETVAPASFCLSLSSIVPVTEPEFAEKSNAGKMINNKVRTICLLM